MNDVKAINQGKAVREIKVVDRTKVMNQTRRANMRKIAIMSVLVLAAAVLYMVVDVNFANEKLFAYSMRIRTPKLIVMLITAFAIGGASIVFQSIINNTIVTPCLLGMNSLYTLIHTAVVFFAGSGSILAVNANLLSTLVASFSNINSEIIIFSLIVLAVVMFVLRKELALLDVITLGKNQAINLGVDYDRTIRRLLLGVTLFIAVATAMVGPISFLGLIIANLARQLMKTFRHGQLVIASTLFGMIVLVGGQIIVEHVFVYSVPVSVFITVGGGIYFLYLLLTNRRV